tara:strand:- start:374 stop:487 length:114 start_codon:yes stop_codon:yes gene_type:complete
MAHLFQNISPNSTSTLQMHLWSMYIAGLMMELEPEAK